MTNPFRGLSDEQIKEVLALRRKKRQLQAVTHYKVWYRTKLPEAVTLQVAKKDFATLKQVVLNELSESFGITYESIVVKEHVFDCHFFLPNEQTPAARLFACTASGFPVTLIE